MLRKNISLTPARLETPSCIRAPPESFRPITGTPFFSARSMTFASFFIRASPSEPPNIVKSWA